MKVLRTLAVVLALLVLLAATAILAASALLPAEDDFARDWNTKLKRRAEVLDR